MPAGGLLPARQGSEVTDFSGKVHFSCTSKQVELLVTPTACEQTYTGVPLFWENLWRCTPNITEDPDSVADIFTNAPENGYFNDLTFRNRPYFV